MLPLANSRASVEGFFFDTSSACVVMLSAQAVSFSPTSAGNCARMGSALRLAAEGCSVLLRPALEAASGVSRDALDFLGDHGRRRQGQLGFVAEMSQVLEGAQMPSLRSN